MIKRLIIALLFAAVSVSICFGQSQFRNFHQEGPASQDIETDQYMANHPSLPLGTQVQVINPRNNNQVIVTITGRIPATEGRIVDLSQGAAKALGFPARGRAPVILQLVDSRRPPPRPAPAPDPEPELEEPPEEPESLPEEPPSEELPPEPESDDEPASEEPSFQEPLMAEPESEAEPEPEPEVPMEQPIIQEPSYPPEAGGPSPTVNNSDSKTQTTAPVSAQSPNITIYNTIMSPGSFATDSAPVIATSGGNPNPITATAPSSAVGSEKGGPVRPAPIIAAAPQSMVSTVEQAPPPPVYVEPEPRSEPAPVDPPRSPPPEPKKETPSPAVATASAQILTVPAPQQPRQVVVQPPAPPVVQAPAQPPVPASSPLPPLRDVGPALIKPYMPNPNTGKIYRVQVGSYKNTWHAKEAYDRLTTIGFRPAYERYEDYIRVVIPGIRTQDMPALAVLIGKVGFREALIREEN
ncbi:MAG: septal ring lytic transglycosylase RlpA family protein [Treponema sp.]|nr:septal ring lytic transglycosylase RlpA family protein [Treponema sp.]